MPNKNFYLFPYLGILILSLILRLSIKHGDVVLFLNGQRTEFFDFFFKYWTHLGDGIFVGSVLLILLIWKWRLAIIFIVLGFAQLISSQGLKRYVFGSVPRPVRYFDGITELNLIDGINHHSSFSFPSGHTITAFAVATFLAIIFAKNRVASVVLLIGAVLVAMSRIYLLQHFLRDVIAGSFIGTGLAIGVFYLFTRYAPRYTDLK